MAEHKLSIEYLSVDDLTPYENNARKHNDEDVSMIENSIEQFDFNDPIGIWGEDNIIVEGHGRLLAAKQAGLTEVPCIRLDHLTEEQRRQSRNCFWLLAITLRERGSKIHLTE